jgi:hypothetical protein
VLGGESLHHGMRGSTKTAQSWDSGAGATGHMAASDLPRARRQEVAPQEV